MIGQNLVVPSSVINVFGEVRQTRNELVCEKSEHKPVQLSFFRLVYLEINPIISVNPVNKPSLSTG